MSGWLSGNFVKQNYDWREINTDSNNLHNRKIKNRNRKYHSVKIKQMKCDAVNLDIFKIP